MVKVAKSNKQHGKPKKRRFQRRARQDDDKVRLQQMFLEVARNELAKHNANDVSMRRIASLAGYSQGVLYRYFPSKPSLVIWVLQENLNGITEELIEMARGIENPRDRLVKITNHYIGYWLDNPSQYRSLYSLSKNREDSRMPNGKWFGESEIVQRGFGVFRSSVSAVFERHGTSLSDELEFTLTSTLLSVAHGAVALPLGAPTLKLADPKLMGRIAVEALVHSWETKIAAVKSGGRLRLSTFL